VGYAYSLRLSDPFLFALSYSGMFQVWDWKNRLNIESCGHFFNPVTCFDADEQTVCLGYGTGHVLIYSLYRQEQPPSIDLFPWPITSLSMKGPLICAASGKSRCVKIYDRTLEKTLLEIDIGHEFSSNDVRWQDHFLYINDQQGGISIWDLETQKKVHSVQCYVSKIHLFEIKGNLLYAISSSSEQSCTPGVWNVATAELLRTFPLEIGFPCSLFVHEDQVYFGSILGWVQGFSGGEAEEERVLKRQWKKRFTKKITHWFRV
jgi:WD40 repeat protein